MNSPDICDVLAPVYQGQQAVRALVDMTLGAADSHGRELHICAESLGCLLSIINQHLECAVRLGNEYEDALRRQRPT